MESSAEYRSCENSIEVFSIQENQMNCLCPQTITNIVYVPYYYTIYYLILSVPSSRYILASSFFFFKATPLTLAHITLFLNNYYTFILLDSPFFFQPVVYIWLIFLKKCSQHVPLMSIIFHFFYNIVTPQSNCMICKFFDNLLTPLN